MKGTKVFVTVETFGGNIEDVSVFEKEYNADAKVEEWNKEHEIEHKGDAEALDDNDGTAIKQYEVKIQ